MSVLHFDVDCCGVPAHHREEASIGQAGRDAFRRHLQQGQEAGVTLRRSLKQWRHRKGFTHPTMRACSDFLRVMGHPRHVTASEVLDLLTSQFHISLLQLPPADSAKLFYPAREAAIFLEVPRLRLPATALLQSYCQSQVPIDQIDNTPCCFQCGGACDSSSNMKSQKIQHGCRNEEYCHSRSDSSESINTTQYFVSSTISTALLQCSFTSHFATAPRVSDSSKITSYGGNESIFSDFDNRPLYDFKARRNMDCWNDCVAPSGFSESSVPEGISAESDKSLETASSLMRLIVRRSVSCPDLYRYCRHTASLHFRRFLWPFTADWLLNDLLNLVALITHRLQFAISIPEVEQLNASPQLPASPQHAPLHGYSTPPLPEQPLTELKMLADVISCSPLAYKLTTAIIECLLVHSAGLLGDTTDKPVIYEAIDHSSFPASIAHKQIINFLLDGGMLTPSVLPLAAFPPHPNDAAPESTTDRTPRVDTSQPPHASMSSGLSTGLEFHLASVRVHLLLELAKENPSISRNMDSLGWSTVHHMELLVRAVKAKRGMSSNQPFNLPTSPVITPMFSNISVEACVDAIKNLVIHSVEDLLTVSLILLHPPYLLLLSELFVESQIFQSDTELIATSTTSQKWTESLLGLLLLPLSFAMLHTNFSRMKAEGMYQPSEPPDPDEGRVRLKRLRRQEKLDLETADSRASNKRPLPTDRGQAKRRRRSFSSAFERDEDLYPPSPSGLAPLRTSPKDLPSNSEKQFGTSTGRGSQNTTSIGVVIQNMRLFSTAGAPSHPVAMNAVARDIRDCFPRLRPATFRFLKLLGRALGSHIEAGSTIGTPLSISAERSQVELEERTLLLNKLGNFFRAVAQGAGSRRWKSSAAQSSDNQGPPEFGSNEVGQLPIDGSSPSPFHSAVKDGEVREAVRGGRSSLALDRSLLGVLLCGILNCGLLLPSQQYLVEFVLKASADVETADALLVHDLAILLTGAHANFVQARGARHFCRPLMRRIALPPSEQSLFQEMIRRWKSLQVNKSRSGSLEGDCQRVESWLQARISRLARVAALVQHTSTFGVTVIDAHDRETFIAAKQFVEARLEVVEGPQNHNEATKTFVDWQVQIWRQILSSFEAVLIVPRRVGLSDSSETL